MMITSKECWLKENCNQCDCDGFCLRLFKLDYLYEEALIPLPLRKHVILVTDEDKTDNEAFTLLSNFSNNIEEFVSEGKNLYIHSSNAGNGKTSWALRLVQSYLNKIWLKSELKCRVLFINVPRLLIELKNNISEKSDYVEHIQSNILKADLVIWDDIATKQSTVFESENLFSMIDTRIGLGKSNIFTSNLSSEELHTALGDRLASRVCNLSMDIEFYGKDKRGLVE